MHKSLGGDSKGGPEGPQNIKMGQPMIPDGPLSAKVVLAGAQRTNCDPEGSPKFLIFPFVTIEKKMFYSLWAPMGPPVAVGPRKKFRVSYTRPESH